MLIIERYFIKLMKAATRCSRKKDVRKNFAMLTGKHLCRSLFLDEAEIKLQAVSPATLSKRDCIIDAFL